MLTGAYYKEAGSFPILPKYPTEKVDKRKPLDGVLAKKFSTSVKSKTQICL